MFFDLLSTPLKKETVLREAPPIPETGWQKPTQFPYLKNAQVIAYDTETKETDFDHGPGWARGTGHIIGVSVAAIAGDGQYGKWYFPVRHEVERHDNLDPVQVFGWLKDTLETTPHVPKVGANLIYDNGWLAEENIRPVGKLYDVQFAEALIDEKGATALDFLARKYVNRGKNTDLCKDWIMRTFPQANLTNWRGFLWRCPPRLVGPYAEDDADLPLAILPRQWAIMEAEETLALFERECASIPMLIKMRQQGVVIDISRAEQLREQVDREAAELYAGLSHKAGMTIDNVSSSTQLQKLFDAVGVQYPHTSTGKPSFKKEWLKTLADTNGYGAVINDIREREKLRDTFLDSYLLNRARSIGGGRGLIYCSFHPLRSDDGGALTGRYSSSHPNLQNIPSRSKLGKEVRTAFVPRYRCWHKKDHSQIEYRLFAHFAVGPRSDEIRYRYNNDPTTDYHNDTMVDVADMRGMVLASMSAVERDLFRKPIKNVNFGLLYGQTERSLAYKAGWSEQESKDFFAAYHAGRPFVRTTMQSIQHEVQTFGFVRTVKNRRTRFNMWEPTKYGEERGALHYDAAVAKFGSNIRRAYAYRGVNYKFQGSAADVLKEGMLQCYEQGVFDYTGYPLLQVHDELDWDKIDDTPAMNEAFRYASHVLENAVKLTIPLKVDSSEGATWGDCA